MDFKNRFQGKISKMTKDGIQGQILTDRCKIQINCNLPLKQIENLIPLTERADNNQQILKNSQLGNCAYNNITQYYENKKQEFDFYSQKRMYTAATPEQSCIQKSINYKPYNYQDFINLQKNKNKHCGGIGPSINSDEWQFKKEKQNKQLNYSEKVKIINKEKLLIKQPHDRRKLFDNIHQLNKNNRYLELD